MICFCSSKAQMARIGATSARGHEHQFSYVRTMSAQPQTADSPISQRNRWSGPKAEIDLVKNVH